MGNTTSTDALQEAVDEVEQQQAGEAQVSQAGGLAA
jgi:hypothetical protein